MMKNIAKQKQEVRKLTPHDLAFGIGRKATDEELDLMLEEMENETFADAEDVMKKISKNLEKKTKERSVKSKI